MKTKKKRSTRRIKNLLFGARAILICLFCTYTIFSDFRTYFDLQASIQASENEYAALREQRDKLLETRNNLTNPDYLEHYGRGHFLVSKDGETIFKFRAIDRDGQTDSE